MIRELRHSEEDSVRGLLAKLRYEDQTLWRKETKPLEYYVEKSRRTPISKEIKGENAIFVAEEKGKIVGLCWCTMVDRGVDKQGEIAEFYVEGEFRGMGIGKELVRAAKEYFIGKGAEVVFVWTRHGNEAAIRLYREEGFMEVTQLVLTFVNVQEVY